MTDWYADRYERNGMGLAIPALQPWRDEESLPLVFVAVPADLPRMKPWPRDAALVRP